MLQVLACLPHLDVTFKVLIKAAGKHINCDNSKQEGKERTSELMWDPMFQSEESKPPCLYLVGSAAVIPLPLHSFRKMCDGNCCSCEDVRAWHIWTDLHLKCCFYCMCLLWLDTQFPWGPFFFGPDRWLPFTGDGWGSAGGVPTGKHGATTQLNASAGQEPAQAVSGQKPSQCRPEPRRARGQFIQLLWWL